jgi:2-polyprenyl-3-methyl-5-hydroxy-6-metoxy-1,4-benzoquinol methylase
VKLTPEKLDDFATTYYLNDDVRDIYIEELQQELSLPRVLQAVGDAQRVLEMGFGTGLITAALLERGIHAEVVEGSPALRDIALARHADQGLVVHLAMFEEFQPAEPYDVVMALHVLEHVDDPQEMLAKVATWLRPGGAVVAVTPNRHSIHRNLAVRMGLQARLDDLSARDHLVGHQRVYGLDTLRAEFERAGFAVEDEFGYFLKTLPNSMMLEYSLPLLQALNAISEEIPPHLLANIGVRAVKQ